MTEAGNRKVFDFLSIETSMEGDRIIAKATGQLGPVFQPFVDRFVGVLNSLKVIAKVDGANMYNLYNPPQPSRAGLRALERKLKEVVFGTVFPATANFAVTFRCQCRCVHCSADPFIDPEREELTTEELKTVISGALDLGSSLVIFTGGEPMLRPDLYELIAHVDHDRAMPMMFTNGQFLTEENVGKLKEAGLMTVNISIDSGSPEIHDKLRRIPGLFEQAIAGGKRAMKAGILAGLSTYANTRALKTGSLERLLKFAQDEGFNEVTIFDCIPSGKWLKRLDIVLTPDERKQTIELAEKYHQMDHPMGVVAQSKVNSPEGAGCFGAHSQFYLTAYGDINPCDFNPISFGNVRDLPIQLLWQKMVNHPDFKVHHKTCRMQTPSYRAKYVDWLADDVHLPVPIEQIDQHAAQAEARETAAK